MQSSKGPQSGENRSIYKVGAWATILVIAGTILDIIIGSSLGGDLTMLPKTAAERFAQFQSNWLLGLYNLDMLNVLTTVLLLPGFFALFYAHSKSNEGYARLSLLMFVTGLIIFVANNSAMAMMDLSWKYANASGDQKMMLAAAGEALLAKGAHGSPGVFYGFIFVIFSEILISFVMLKAKIFSRTTSYLGMIGSVLLGVYLVFVTFIPQLKPAAMILAMPGGLMVLAWMLMFTVRLFKLEKNL